MVAELPHGCHRMGDKEKCRSIFQHMMHAFLAFFLECRISDGQHLIDDQYLRLHDRGDSKSQAGCHTGGVVLDRHIHEVFEFCKFDDLIVVCIHEFFAVTENGTIQIDVFRRSQFAVESGARESKYRLAAAEENVRLMELLNAEMERHLERMNDMIDGLERSNNKQRDIARITLLMCYIKRRCSLFFKEQEGGDMPAEELAVYIDELSEFASYADIRISTVCTAKGSLSPRCGSVMYDFFYSVLDSCAGEENTLLERLADTDGMTEMKLLPSSFDTVPPAFRPDSAWKDASSVRRSRK